MTLTRALVDELRKLEQQIGHGLPEIEHDMKALVARAAAAIEEHLDAIDHTAEPAQQPVTKTPVNGL